MILLDFLLKVRAFFEFILSPALPTLKIASVLLSLLFIVLSVVVSIMAQYAFDFYDAYTQIFRGGDLYRKDSIRGWKKILRLVRSDNPEDWRKALMLAGKIFDEVLKLAGYLGTSVYERLEQVTPEVVKNIEALKQAHAFSERVAAEPEMPLTKKETVNALRAYREAFQGLELLDSA